MGIFDFFKRSKFLKMSNLDKAKEQTYAILLCVEFIATMTRAKKGENKISNEDFEIIKILAKSLNIGSEYYDCDLRKNFFEYMVVNNDYEHFKEVLSSLTLKNKRITIKQMLLVYSNREDLKNLLDDNGNIIHQGKYMTEIEKIIFFMGINEELEGLIQNMIYEINKKQTAIDLFSFKQKCAILEIVLFIGLNELTEEQNLFIIDIVTAFKINPEDEVTLSQLERSNLLKELNTKQSKYIIGLINEMNKLGNVSEIKHKEIFKILNQYGLNESIIEAISPSIYNKNHSEIKLIEEAVSDINSDQGDPNFYKFINYLDDHPNLKDIYNKITNADKMGFTISQYLQEENYLSNLDNINILIEGFSDIKNLLDNMLEDSHNDNIIKDIKCLDKAISILKRESTNKKLL